MTSYFVAPCSTKHNGGGGVVAYRYDPYTLRGVVHLDARGIAKRKPSHVKLRLPSTNGATPGVEVVVPRGVVLKADDQPIALRPYAQRVALPFPAVRPQQQQQQPPAAQSPIGPARRALKKAYEASRATAETALLPVAVEGFVHGRDPDRRELDTITAANRRSAARVQRATGELPMDTICSGHVTLTHLPNVDGHRVAKAVLDEFRHRGYMDGVYALAHDAERMDRFNTAAIHVVFELVEDAERVQVALHIVPLFVDTVEETEERT